MTCVEGEIKVKDRILAGFDYRRVRVHVLRARLRSCVSYPSSAQ